jgi:hypothetical protein
MTEVKTNVIDRGVIENAYTYQEYRDMIDARMEEGKTTGDNHSEAMLHYTKMNVHRMQRQDKRAKLTDDVKTALDGVERKLIWLVLTEAWCGDAAQSLSAIQKMADYSDNIQARYILRDDNLDIMDEFLTNGKSRSIPKLICLDAQSLDVLGTWGPRPANAQKLYDEWRSVEGVAYQEVAKKLHKWYAKDGTRSMQSEFAEIIPDWS